MVEKRPFPGDGHAANGVKRPKPSATSINIQDKLAEAKAKAAAIKARAAAGTAIPSTNGASTPSSAAAPMTAAEKLAAMKARMAALKANAASTSAPAQAAHSSTTPSRTEDARPRYNEAMAPRFPTTLGNRATESPAPTSKPDKREPKKEEQEGEEDTNKNPYWDPKSAGTARDNRVSKALLFNQRGKYSEQASKLRRQTKLEEIKALLANRNRLAKLDENSERGFLVPQPPDVEWWDEGILEDKTYDCIDNPSKVKIDSEDSIITVYVQHPVLLKAPQDQLLIPVKPMYLTTKEQAKLRRMRRAEEHKEQQAKIRLGLEPPPPPKVKRGNMMRVMGEQAIADPTAVEMLVEAQIQERHEKHVQTNEERKLTDEQRRAKIAENQKKDAQKGLYMCVFKIDSLVFGKHRYQIDHNAKEHALTGVTIFNPKMNLVIVEGGHWSIQKYKRLMLNRIKWTENMMPSGAQIEKQSEDPQWLKPLDDTYRLKDNAENRCLLVFEGEVKQRAFRKWGSKICESDGEAKEILARAKLDSLWALAKNTL
ncbi:PRP3-domain-containing protein [Sporormia fimetaria CBS 119925]|uniref:PRP3-domain-containing protein n=1 Tax=Sporormia fimetaria CBS 119925 TaxID=1340428 RepID=A0A6A6VD32_9PLEO|nr:PRP3-domain-containing protein [Sporormia fimetaria CBS 119925]